MMKKFALYIAAFVSLGVLYSCQTTNQPKSEKVIQQLATSPFTNGVPVTIMVIGGREYRYPIMAIWVEDLNGNFLGTLYASKSISTGIFRYGVYDKGKWLPGERNRPAALPRWKSLTSVNVQSVSQDVDAFSGATPSASFKISTTLPSGKETLRVYLEVNKPWDFNSYWHNNRFPGDEEYATSGQPALIYEAVVNFSGAEKRFDFKPIGHSHPSGKDGEISKDITTFTSALQIIDSAWVELADNGK